MMAPRRRVVIALLLASGLLAIAVLPGRAVDVVRLQLGTLDGAGWSAETVTVQLNWLDDGYAGLLLHTQRAALPAGLGELSGVELSCPRAQLTATLANCEQGTLKAHSSVLGRQNIQTRFRYRFDSNRIEVGLSGVRVHDGTLVITAELSGSHWQVNASGEALSLPAVTRQLAGAGIALPVVDGNGQLDIIARITGVAAQLTEADVDIQLRAAELSDADGSVAAENLDVSLHAVVKPGSAGMQVALDMVGRQGALYVEPVFIEMPSLPLTLSAHVDWLSAKQQLLVRSFTYQHPGNVQLEGNGHIDLAADAPLQALRVEVLQAGFPSLYDTYLKPWLFGTMLADLAMSGQISGALHWEQGKLSHVSLDPLNLSVDDREGRFALDRVNGRIRWVDSATPARSELTWASGSVFKVALGATRFGFDASRDSVQLVEPVEIPVLDGALRIDDFQLEYGENLPLRWQVNGLLEPVSLSQLSLALGWPELAGKLSGVIPNVRYDDGDLKVGGILLIRVFDGEVTLRNLSLERPFGLVPRLQVDARADNVDLETLTRTFSFGRIEGRLNGRIDGLDMESWRPVAFDAEFATPEDDRSRHRISQRAVDNISSIGGGGVGGALSRSFLRFFEDFPYDRLGIRCRLANGICDMGGVAPAKNGYYLVKGRLIPPRLDVIGYADRVDWDTLIAQIMAVTVQQEAVVE
ncbi:MAG: hypothetical protein WBP44_17005 [Gammaproteobacteria bacterium]